MRPGPEHRFVRQAVDEAYAEAVLGQVAELREQLWAMRNPEALAELGSGLAPAGFQPPARG